MVDLSYIQKARTKWIVGVKFPFCIFECMLNILIGTSSKDFADKSLLKSNEGGAEDKVH